MKNLYSLLGLFLVFANQILSQCPNTITVSEASGCGIYNLHLNEFPAMGNIIWTYDGGNPISSGSNNILWASMTPGMHVVCAEAWTGECVEGTTVCVDILVPTCNSIFCPSEIIQESVGCNSFVFSIPTEMNGYAIWNFGDGSAEEISQTNPDHVYTENGVYTVTATYYSELCPLGVPLYTVVTVDCAVQNCPLEIWSGAGDVCGLMNFEIGSFVEGESVIWYPGDETGPIEGGHFLSHQYASGGTYTVCAYYTSPLCPNGVELCTTITVENCNTNTCPTFITSEAVDCNTLVFHMNESASGYAIWNFGDDSEPLTWQGNPEHSYNANGVYVVSATFYGMNCQEGVTLYYTVNIACEENSCPLEIWSGAGDVCGLMNFEIGSFVEGESVIWYPGDETGPIEDGHFLSHQYASGGTYTVCAYYTSPLCPNGVELCTTITVENCNTNTCPTFITSEAVDCNTLVFHMNESASGYAIWNFGDDSEPLTWQGNPEHSYNANGVYVVSATFYGMNCQEGVTLYYTVNIACEENSCPLEIWSGAGDVCGLMNFEIGSFVEGESVIWYPGDETGPIEGGHFLSHQYASGGTYTVCAYYTSPLCPNGVELCTTITVENCNTNECPQEIWTSPGETCGLQLFEAGGFVSGESFIWYFGDDTGGVEGGHYITHQYASPGTYIVNCIASNDFCEGYQLTITVVIEPCTECNEVSIGIDSYVNNGGTDALVYSLYNEEDQSIMYFNQVTYTANDPYFDELYCLPDGCYILTIDNNNPLNLGSGVNIFIMYNGQNLMETAEIIYQDDVAVSLRFGINSDCGSVQSCEAAFEAIYTNTPGHLEFINNSIYTGDAQFIWSYGDGQVSDGQSGNVFYTENGIYNVCLTVITDNCEASHCQEVVIENMENGCQQNEVLVTITAEYSENLNDLITLVLLEEDVVIGAWELPLLPGFSQTFSACIPNGCYILSLNSDIPLNADLINVQISYNNETIELAEILQGESSATLEFGLNADCTVGQAEFDDNPFSLYPNPSQGFITLRSSKREISSVQIFDLTGREVLTFNPRAINTTIDLSSFASGIYTARISDGQETQIIRFEIAR